MWTATTRSIDPSSSMWTYEDTHSTGSELLQRVPEVRHCCCSYFTEETLEFWRQKLFNSLSMYEHLVVCAER